MTGLPASNPPPPGEIDDLFKALDLIERDLAALQNQIVPALKKFGVHLDTWALTIGQGYQQQASDLYAQIQARREARGDAQADYTYEDLNDLETAGQMAKRGQQLQFWGVAVAKTVQLGAWAAGVFGKVQAEMRVIDLVETEKARLPEVMQLIAMGEQNVTQLLEDNDRFFRMSAARVAHSAKQRVVIERALDMGLATYQRLAEAHARLDYYRAVYDCIAAFDRYHLKESIQQLVQTGIEDRPIFQLQGMSYLQRLDASLAPLHWKAPYYQNGLPAGVAYFMAKGRRRLPAGVRLETIDRDMERVRKETPRLTQPRYLFQAARYLHEEVGDIAAPFPEQARLARRIGKIVLIAAAALAVLLALVLTGAGARILDSLQLTWYTLTHLLPQDTPLQRMTVAYMAVLVLGAVGYLVWFYWNDRRRRR